MIPQTPRRSALAAALLCFALTSAGCERSAPPADAEPATPPDQTYTVRGEVAGMPREGDALRQIRIHHEALPGFVGIEGDVVGMASMTMPFPVANSVDLDDLENGDKVEMTFEVRWEGSPPLQVVELEKLPADTPLDFETHEVMPGEGEVDGTGSAPP